MAWDEDPVEIRPYHNVKGPEEHAANMARFVVEQAKAQGSPAGARPVFLLGVTEEGGAFCAADGQIPTADLLELLQQSIDRIRRDLTTLPKVH